MITENQMEKKMENEMETLRQGLGIRVEGLGFRVARDIGERERGCWLLALRIW